MSRMRLATAATAVAAAAAALLAAGCGSTAATSPPAARPLVAGLGAPTLATSASSSSGTSWAIVDMGGKALNSFWELFVRAAGGTSWQLVTPPGAASNGGLVMAATGATSLVTGFRPTQLLKFSPLAATANAGAQWSQSALLSPGLGDVPDALAGGSDSRLIALTGTGDVEASTSLGASWTRLTTRQALAGSAAGRACGLRALTAAALTQDGSPLVAANCGTAGVVGIFAQSAGTWRRAGPTLPTSMPRAAVDVLGLATSGTRTTAIIATATRTGTSVLAAWSSDGGTTWQLSPVLAVPAADTTAARTPSVSIWADGSAGLVLPAANQRSGAIIGWQAAAWHTLPALPAKTATLAIGPGGQPQALSVSPATMTAWQLAGSSQWTPTQTVRVTIPYGTSG